MSIRTVVAIGLVPVLNAVPALGHGGKSYVKGTIMAIDARQIVVKEENGKSISIRVNRDTIYQRYESEARAATQADLKVGNHVAIDLFGMPGGEKTALEIHISPPSELERNKEAAHHHVEQR